MAVTTNASSRSLLTSTRVKAIRLPFLSMVPYKTIKVNRRLVRSVIILVMTRHLANTPHLAHLDDNLFTSLASIDKRHMHIHTDA